MPLEFWILLVGLTAVAFVTKCDGSIKCYQCHDCPDDDHLPEPEECEKGTLYEAASNIDLKIKPDQPTVLDEKAWLPMLYGNPPASCFKLTLHWKDEDTVYRGCSPATDTDAHECKTYIEGQVTCFCEGDGCNSASTVYVSIVLLGCLSILIAVLNI